ncbi:MAG TPA: exosortase/archaeosortase family protein [Dehalococcoidia bacterium]|nr:exosortase/archaeosortase family protein [Dehalococcoidia bacterium]
MKSSKPKHKPTQNDKQFLLVGFLFCSSVILLDIVVWYLGRKEYLAFLDIFLSYVMEGLIRLSGLHVVRDSNQIFLTNSLWIVTTECTAIFIMLIYSSFIIVYPATRKAKGMAVIAGIPFIFSINCFRLLIMAWIDKIKPQYSEFFHNYLWQVVFIVMVVWMWLLWIDKVVNRETKTSTTV